MSKFNFEQRQGMYLTKPWPASNMFHIFDKEDRSLCGKAMMLRKNPDCCEPFGGTEKYHKGQDCKACFRKAGLII